MLVRGAISFGAEHAAPFAVGLAECSKDLSFLGVAQIRVDALHPSKLGRDVLGAIGPLPVEEQLQHCALVEANSNVAGKRRALLSGRF